MDSGARMLRTRAVRNEVLSEPLCRHGRAAVLTHGRTGLENVAERSLGHRGMLKVRGVEPNDVSRSRGRHSGERRDSGR